MRKWSKINKEFKNLRAKSMEKTIDIGITSYRKAHDNAGRGYIRINGIEILNACTLSKNIEMNKREKENKNIEIDKNLLEKEKLNLKNNLLYEDYNKEKLENIAINRLIYEISEKELLKENIYEEIDLVIAIEEFLKIDIKEAIKSDNNLINIFYLIDRRVGKRTLKKIEKEIEEKDELVKNIYKLRCIKENIV